MNFLALGTNPVRKQDLSDDGQQLWIQECFATIQGEGPFAGKPAVFVRLAGCNLRCWFCDTDFESSEWHPYLATLIAEIVTLSKIPSDSEEKQKIGTYVNTNLVVITGGEPFRQNIIPLVRKLALMGYKIQIETSGTLWLKGFDTLLTQYFGNITIVCSPKTPSLNKDLQPHITAYKYIIRHGEPFDEQDGLPITDTQTKGRPSRIARPLSNQFNAITTIPIYVQACDEQDRLKNKLNLECAAATAMKHGYILSVQLHKLVGLK